MSFSYKNINILYNTAAFSGLFENGVDYYVTITTHVMFILLSGVYDLVNVMIVERSATSLHVSDIYRLLP